MTITTTVDAVVSLRPGQAIFLSSDLTSRKNCLTLSTMPFTSTAITSPFIAHACVKYGRPGGIRTPITRIWSPVLYPLELLA